jgi:hypothetical protein
VTLILWLLGILGIGGTVALFIFAPALAMTIMEGVGKLLGAMVQTRTGVGILVGVAALVAGELHGRHVANTACHEADVRAQDAVLARDLAIKSQAADDAAKRAAELDKAQQDNEGRIHELETALKAKPPPAVCRLDPDGGRRLRSIR